jgi:glycosyltransferase involved in cell wall biosynthesis
MSTTSAHPASTDRLMEPVPLSTSGGNPSGGSPLGGNWMSVVTHLDPKYGGLSSAVPALASAVAAAGQLSTSIASFCLPGEHFAPVTTSPVAVRYMPLGRMNWFKDSSARHTFHNLVDHSAGVHIHGLWEHSTSAAAQRARALQKPYVVSAHGMLERWALANKRAKKTIYAALFERANLQKAACLHALTEAEARDYRNFGLSNPIAVIPNGVTIPAHFSADNFLNRFPEFRDRRLVLFLGRIHFKKGLDILAQAWGRVAAKWPDACLVLAGPDSEDTQITLEKQLATLGIGNRVKFTGMLSHEAKWSALAAAECFVLPSYSEGLSVSVLEAMGAGLPVIITNQCNLPEVKEHGCGWVIEPKVDELVSSLNAMLSSSSRDVAEMASNGRQLVARNYSWAGIGERMSSVYNWLNGGPVPSQVEMHERLN